MFKAIGWLLKLTIFAALVLVLGNYFKWGGKTVSDQVKTQMAKAQSLEVPTAVQGWASELISDTGQGSRKGPVLRKAEKEQRPEEGTDIPSSERQKLKTLIRDLNTSYGRN
jgi:hypothetical protein